MSLILYNSFFRINKKIIDIKKCQSKVYIKQKKPDRTVCDLFRKKRLVFALFVNGYIT